MTHRDVMLEALSDSPQAFWETAAEAQAKTEAQWRSDLSGSCVHLHAIVGAGNEDSRSVVAGAIGVLPEGYTDEHEIDEDQAIIVGMYVRPPFRGTGVAGELLTAAARVARELGRPRLLLESDSDNQRAIAFYVRHGFTATGQRFPHEGTGTEWVEFSGHADHIGG